MTVTAMRFQPIINLRNTYHNRMKRKTPQKDNRGKFIKANQIPVLPLDIRNSIVREDFIKAVKSELFQGLLDYERIANAYMLISGNQTPININTMRKIILTYTGN